MTAGLVHPGRNVLVQGASRGLGLALVRALLERVETERVFATCRNLDTASGLAALRERHGDALSVLPLDVRDESSIASAAERVAERTDRLHLLFNAAGLLHDGPDFQPEKRLEAVTRTGLLRSFEVNALGPILVARHFLGLLRHDERAVLANLSARVGSIGDNRAGGWYGYRASKAAQNMLTRTLALELKRRAKNAICVALHPGTVDTDLSGPFQRSVPASRIFDTKRASDQLLAVVDGLTPDRTGSFLAWDGTEIPW